MNPNAIENFYWEETCIDEAQCYTFTVNATAAVIDLESSGLEYLLLYDNDVHVASESNILASAIGVAGNCGGGP